MQPKKAVAQQLMRDTVYVMPLGPDSVLRVGVPSQMTPQEVEIMKGWFEIILKSWRYEKGEAENATT